MIRYSRSIGEPGDVRAGCAGLALALGVLLSACQASAQPAPTNPQDAAPAPDSAFRPGFIDAFGRFIGDSAAKLNSQFNSQLDSARQTLGDFGDQTSDAAKTAAQGAVGAAKDTAGAIVGLPSARFVDGRERCALATNGAADCRAAADVVCRGKGFAGGKIVDTRSEQKCPARVWLSGHLPREGECPLDTFVTRAVCQ
jgi:hypothetical protein